MDTVIGQFEEREEAVRAVEELSRRGHSAGLRRVLDTDWRGLGAGEGPGGPYDLEHEPATDGGRPLRDGEGEILVLVEVMAGELEEVERLLASLGALTVQLSPQTPPEALERFD